MGQVGYVFRTDQLDFLTPSQIAILGAREITRALVDVGDGDLAEVGEEDLADVGDGDLADVIDCSYPDETCWLTGPAETDLLSSLAWGVEITGPGRLFVCCLVAGREEGTGAGRNFVCLFGGLERGR